MEEKCNIIECDIYHAISKIKSRYSSVFLFSLNSSPKKFNEIADEFSFINHSQVSRTLKDLITSNLVVKVDNFYKLSKSGQALIPILLDLEHWNSTFSI